MGFDLLKICAPVLRLMPTVPKPTRKLDIKKRLAWTAGALGLYLICTLTPLYGVKRIAGGDAMYHLRLLTASSKFTLMELGISPIVSSSMILQMISGFGILKRDNSDQESMALFEAAQKLVGLIMTAFQAISAVATGQYDGVYDKVTKFGAIAIVVQLITAGIVVILLDELLQNGYGIGSGISLFIATNICTNIVWQIFSFSSSNYGRGVEFEGALIALFHLLIVRKDKLRALREAMFRSHLPNIRNVFSTALIFCTVIFFEHIKINIPLETTVSKQQAQPFEIKLFYTSNTPIIIQSTIVQQFCSFSKIIANHWQDSLVTRILGVWQSPEQGLDDSYAVPVSGLAYYLQAPRDIRHILLDPLHTILYLIISLSTAGLIAYYYINIGGQSSKDVARNLKNQHLTSQGHRANEESIVKKLDPFIPPTAALGGILTALLSFIADIIGAFGSGTGIILAISIINQFSEELTKEGLIKQYLG